MKDSIKKEILELCIYGLKTDGGHHKQWFLEEIIKKLDYDIIEISREILEEEAEETGENPDDYRDSYCDGEYLWEDGIPP